MFIPLPSPTQIDTAVEWLRQNEGEGAEGEACRAVADWIERLAFEQMLQQKARKAGVPVARLRRKLAALREPHARVAEPLRSVVNSIFPQKEAAE